jgi:CHAT domain-containing protein
MLPGERGLNDMLAPVLADMAEPGRSAGESDARRLAESLLSGVADIWGAGQTLAIVPDLSLFGVPWAALPLPGKNCALIDHGPLVILDMPFSTLEGRICHEPDGRLLVVGANRDAAAQNAGLSKLHHAEREARDVAAAWPAGRAVLRVGEDASKALTANPDLASFEAIHVASHALVFNGHSERTMLLLAGDNAEALTAARIRELNLCAELVFLSCCEAADGYGKRSGYAGLSRSFLDAGARNVVAPLIVIDDEAARTLATRFYFHWLAGLPVPEALRAAQRDLRDGDVRWAHPFYWAFYQAIASDVPAESP